MALGSQSNPTSLKATGLESGQSLRQWLGPLESDAARLEELRVRQMPTFELMRKYGNGLPDDFIERAFAYSVQGYTFCNRIMRPDADLESIPFRVTGFDAVTRLTREGRAPLVLMAHMGFWNSVIIHTAKQGAPFTLLIEEMPEELVAFYRSQSAEPIIASPALSLQLDDGRSLQIPGSNPLAQVKSALREGKLVGMFADSYRKNGVGAKLLGVDVSMINHYALVAVQENCPVFMLNQWTTDAAIHMDFFPLDTASENPSKMARVEKITRQFTDGLERHLREWPEQYAYIPPNVFGLSNAEQA